MNRVLMIVTAVASAVIVGYAVSIVDTSVEPVALLCAAVLCVYLLWTKISRSISSKHSVFPALFLLVLPCVLALGAVLNRPRFSIEQTSSGTWAVIAVGTAGFAAAKLILGRPHAEIASETIRRPSLQAKERALLDRATFIALAVATVNLLTGQIALLAHDTNAVRFSGSFGLLEKFWPIVFGVLQASFVLRIVGRRGRSMERRELAILAAIAGVFILSAGRAFLALCLAAIAIEVYERRKIALSAAAAVFVAGALIAGLAGYTRAIAQYSTAGANAAWVEQGLPKGPLGSVLQSVVAGPWVLSRTIATVPDAIDFQMGRFVTADFMNFLHGETQRSDRWVTEQIMHRDIATVGGLPPTIVGGLWIDFGIFGVFIGMMLFGWITARLYRRSRAIASAVRSSEYAFWCAYLLLAIYAYVSIKPQVVAAFVVFRLVDRTADTVSNARDEVDTWAPQC